MSDLLNVTTGDGKYTVVQKASGAVHALRHNEPWRDCIGDKLVLTLAQDVAEMRSQLEAAKAALRSIVFKADSDGCYYTSYIESTDLTSLVGPVLEGGNGS